jgi:hypothetical protein
VDAGKAGFYALLSAAVAGCGGGASHDSGGSGTSYAYVVPIVNSTRVYTEAIVDNSNNTINVGFSQTVQAVNGDGSIVEMEQSTTGPSAVINGTNYAIPTETQTYNAQGQETEYVDLSVTPNLSCNLDPHGAGPNWPVQVGQTWSLDYNLTCGTTVSIAYTQTGSVIGVESVAVPAGTFMAIKLQSIISWTSANGTMRTETTTNWRDLATSYSVKQSISVAVSGTAPTSGYPVSRQIELQSFM